uniref:Uncharacterized protein n=1 Tax=Timema douglasi TaxID=61478 RepID=A0A7R8W0G6_TIMDO|nr:unnamed protein product [Timema douglasi]
MLLLCSQWTVPSGCFLRRTRTQMVAYHHGAAQSHSGPIATTRGPTFQRSLRYKARLKSVSGFRSGEFVPPWTCAEAGRASRLRTRDCEPTEEDVACDMWTSTSTWLEHDRICFLVSSHFTLLPLDKEVMVASQRKSIVTAQSPDLGFILSELIREECETRNATS